MGGPDRVETFLYKKITNISSDRNRGRKVVDSVVCP
jgi:hypothetical protein